ncbi:hypothetical protein MERGE_000823 [Pneumocystis wakefieldiae]|uniref:RRM domain-containing protein n=1 Tax=Pneumocystis wakefieldiae TaxID=38082 RepID=A0A899G0X2_9ASCO|nr:hypothetical protein MERGE_000823 [Pneumocystis wakefieldiae]
MSDIIDVEALVEAPYQKNGQVFGQIEGCVDRSRERSRRRRDEHEDHRHRDHHHYRDGDRHRRSREEEGGGHEQRSRSRESKKSRQCVREESPKLTEDERDRRTVFVQQLAARLRTRELIAFFEKVGPVRDAQVVKDRVSGRSKGVGYVEFRNEESVHKAINMTGQRLLGIPIIVQLTEAEKNRQARTEAMITSGGRQNDAPFHRLYIFEPFGELEFVQLQKEHDTGRSRGYGFVQYRDPSQARDALEKMNGFELAGRAIRVGLGNDKFIPETSSVLARFSGFTGSAFENKSRGGTERIGGPRDGSSSISLDDNEAGGVSFNNISRDALMKKLAREEEKQSIGVVHHKPAPSIQMTSRCVLLKNMFNPQDGDNWIRELEDDVKAECENKYGKVLHIHVEENSPGESVQAFLLTQYIQQSFQKQKVYNKEINN